MEKKLHFLHVPIYFKWNNAIKVVIAFVFIIMQSMETYSQDINTKFNLSVKDTPLRTVFESMRKQSKLDFIYSDDEIKNYKVTVNVNGAVLKVAMAEVLKDLPFTYEVKDNRIISVLPKMASALKQEIITIQGKVVNEQKAPVEGATLIILGTTKGAVCDGEGKFSLSANRGDVIEINCVGMISSTYVVRGEESNLILKMKTSAIAVDDVVVTGIYTRKKESFTGSATSYSTKDLRSIGSTNVLQALKSLDPAFAMIENNEFGSDPNRMPDIEIRGKSSLLGVRDNLAADPNQPLFMLDGFESTLEAIVNLDMNRVESITILKDAASAAIHGSKAANGVVVVETIKPKAGELRVSYNGNANIQFPDLTSYNMMNSAEKLDFERIAGRYDGSYANKDIILKDRYFKLLDDVTRGIDTYWLAEPLRVGVNHRHSIYLTGGSENFMFTAGGSYNGITGVMKQSKRESISGNIDMVYRINKLQFTNQFTVDNTSSDNPNVPFNEFVNANPYYTKYNENGLVDKWLEYNVINDILNVKSPNPLYNNNLNSFDKNKITNYSDKFMAEYSPIPELKIRGKFSLSRQISKGTKFKSPDHTDFETKELLYRGTYNRIINDGNKYEGELTVTFGKTFDGGHQINAVVGANMYSEKSIVEGYSVLGFPSGDFTFPSFSKGYPEEGTPTYNESLVRSVSAFANLGYSFRNKYLLDVSYRVNGSSIFGAAKRYANTWSVGLGYNLANEKFIKDNTDLFNMLKLRASIGNPGNQNFNSFMTFSSYRYTFNSFNYFGMNSILNIIGNPNLKWQTTIDKNIGFDMTILNNRLTVNFDYYHKFTDPLLIAVNVPSSTGVTVENTNLGDQTTTGINASVMYYIIHRPSDRFTWNVRANLRHNKNKLGGIGNALESLNKYGQTNKSLVRYYDGADPDDLWAVKSIGIDPANGRELLIKKDGTRTYDYDISDEIISGNSRPKVEGVFGSGFSYKGFSVDLTLRYKLGNDLFNNALFTKVEGISADSYNYNLDKRAYYDRWQKPGDKAKYKNIADAATSKMTSRFIAKENTLSIESIRVGYEFPAEFAKKLCMSSLKIDAYVTDIARFSTIKTERGIYYPFSRSFQLALSINF